MQLDLLVFHCQLPYGMKITFSVVKFLGLMTHLKLVPLLYSDTCLKQEHSKKSSRRVLGNHQCEEL